MLLMPKPPQGGVSFNADKIEVFNSLLNYQGITNKGLKMIIYILARLIALGALFYYFDIIYSVSVCV